MELSSARIMSTKTISSGVFPTEILASLIKDPPFSTSLVKTHASIYVLSLALPTGSLSSNVSISILGLTIAQNSLTFYTLYSKLCKNSACVFFFSKASPVTPTSILSDVHSNA